MQRRSVLALIPLAAAVLALAACSLPAMNKQADAEAKELYTQIAEGKDLSLNTNLSDDLQNGDDRGDLGAIMNLMPNSPPTKVANSGWSFNTNNGATRAVLRHLYTYGDGTTILSEAVLFKGGGADHWTIIGFWATRQSDGTRRGAGSAPADSSDNSNSYSGGNGSGGDNADRDNRDRSDRDADSDNERRSDDRDSDDRRRDDRDDERSSDRERDRT